MNSIPKQTQKPALQVRGRAVRDFASVAPWQGRTLRVSTLPGGAVACASQIGLTSHMDTTGETHRQRETALFAISLITMDPSVLQHQAKAVNTVLESIRKSKLLPQKVLSSLPPLGSTDGHRDPKAVLKLFYPDFSWTWYAIEFDGDDTFFGLVDGDVRELGYFSLSELLRNSGHCGMQIERDRAFEPTPLSDIS